ncbi:hypothetical protein LC087_10555 [Bacillus carboniphilus]|uniref:Spore germination protein n=1 Tax=Bacillus carboniphilus TaxID=86663 RepID=A0ABY9JS86_9BACI|nr:hypothetical protein [Bacillus carboniphilus]WLR41353.1 hypothetical protein LC087_10555 [Bacillus carboniphilus]
MTNQKPMNINVAFIKVTTIDGCSSLNIGQSFLADLSNSTKKNQGYGENFGDGAQYIGPQSLLDDHDYIDSPALSKPTIQRNLSLT